MLSADKERSQYSLIECYVCGHHYVRSNKRGVDWNCPKCGSDDFEPIDDADPPVE